ncbi:MAG: signal peptidase I [bacterium]
MIRLIRATKITNKNLKVILLCAGLVWLGAVGLWWLVVGIIAIILICWTFPTRSRSVKGKIAIGVLRSTIIILGLFLLIILIKIFLIEIFNIPSVSMENTLHSGDKVVIGKICYGPRLPRSPLELPWASLFFSNNKYKKDSANARVWKYKRFAGYNRVERGDIVAFNHPDDQRRHLIKRCVALPGDTIVLINGNIWINNNYFAPTQEAKFNFSIFYNDPSEISKLIDSLNINNSWSIGPNFYYLQATMSIQEMRILVNTSCVDSLLQTSSTNINGVSKIGLSSSEERGIYNQGPMLVPQEGTTIKITDISMKLYGRIIRDSEMVQIIKKGDKYFLLGKEIKDYTFTKNYYFMMGDNRPKSIDSREFGMVPEDHIFGKGILVLFSINNGKMKWNRILKVV